MQRHRCGRPRGSVSRAAAPGAATVRKEPHIRTLPGDRPLSFRRAGRSRTRAGRPRPALHPDGTTACPRPGARRRASPKAVRSRQRIARSPPPAALPDAAQRWRGAAAPLQQLLRRGAARRRARAHSEDGWTTVATLSAACGAAGPRAAGARSPGPGRAIGRAARKKRDAYWCAGRQHDEPPYTHGARAKRGPRASHTHYQHTTSATRRPAREKHTAHTPNSNLNATACLQNAPSPDRGAGDGTAFSLTATERPRDGGTVRPCGPLTYGPPVPGACAIQRPLLETQSRPETTHAQVLVRLVIAARRTLSTDISG